MIMGWWKNSNNALMIPEVQGVTLIVYENPKTFYTFVPLTEIELQEKIKKLNKDKHEYVITRTK